MIGLVGGRGYYNLLNWYRLLAMLPGSKYPNEYVFYMAHWDHFGNAAGEGVTGDTIYNGAVDNATGVAGILEVAKAFRAGRRPDRSIVFVAVTAEESGLLGSAYYGQNPVFPLGRTAAAINIDAMYPIGRMKDIEVVGFGAFGRVYIAGEEAEVIEARKVVEARLASLSPQDFIEQVLQRCPRRLRRCTPWCRQRHRRSFAYPAQIVRLRTCPSGRSRTPSGHP